MSSGETDLFQVQTIRYLFADIDILSRNFSNGVRCKSIGDYFVRSTDRFVSWRGSEARTAESSSARRFKELSEGKQRGNETERGQVSSDI